VTVWVEDPVVDLGMRLYSNVEYRGDVPYAVKSRLRPLFAVARLRGGVVMHDASRWWAGAPAVTAAGILAFIAARWHLEATVEGDGERASLAFHFSRDASFVLSVFFSGVDC
jgi:hypothetical protein